MISFYQFADLNNAETVKTKCVNFIVSNFSQVAQTEEWKRNCITGGKMIVDVTCAIAKNQNYKTDLLL